MISKEANTLPEVLRKIRKDFEAHIQSGKLYAFIPEAQDNLSLSELTRQLEIKRQTSELSAEERFTLQEIDKLIEDIARFNPKSAQKQSIASLSSQEKVYDLNTSELKAPGPAPEAITIPKVSSREADKIIDGLNEQFVDKVLKKLKDRTRIESRPSWEVNDFSVPVDTQSAGPSLYDYLAKMRVELPDQPFSDADSDKDLSKLKTKVK